MTRMPCVDCTQVRHPLALGGRACLPLAPPTPLPAPAPKLILGGDAYAPLGSRADGCLQSGLQLADAVLGTDSTLRVAAAAPEAPTHETRAA